MDEHLVKCEAIGEEDSWGYDASSSSLDITDGIEELDDSGGDPAPVSTSLATSTGVFQTYRRIFYLSMHRSRRARRGARCHLDLPHWALQCLLSKPRLNMMYTLDAKP